MDFGAYAHTIQPSCDLEQMIPPFPYQDTFIIMEYLSGKTKFYHLPDHRMVCVRVIETGVSAHGSVGPRESNLRKALTMLRLAPMSTWSEISPHNLSSLFNYCRVSSEDVWDLTSVGVVPTMGICG